MIAGGKAGSEGGPELEGAFCPKLGLAEHEMASEEGLFQAPTIPPPEVGQWTAPRIVGT